MQKKTLSHDHTGPMCSHVCVIIMKTLETISLKEKQTKPIHRFTVSKQIKHVKALLTFPAMIEPSNDSQDVL